VVKLSPAVAELFQVELADYGINIFAHLLEPFQNYSDEQIEEYQWHKQVESHEEYYA
jgi:hypothetical protein